VEVTFSGRGSTKMFTAVDLTKTSYFCSFLCRLRWQTILSHGVKTKWNTPFKTIPQAGHDTMKVRHIDHIITAKHVGICKNK